MSAQPHSTVLSAMAEACFTWDAERQVFRPSTAEERGDAEPTTERRPGHQRGNLSAKAWAEECARLGTA